MREGLGNSAITPNEKTSVPGDRNWPVWEGLHAEPRAQAENLENLRFVGTSQGFRKNAPDPKFRKIPKFGKFSKIHRKTSKL